MPPHASKPEWLEPQGPTTKSCHPLSCGRAGTTTSEPMWTSQPHSAASLHDKVTKSVALFSPHRYDTKPLYRQIPIDGVNAKSTLRYILLTNTQQEDIILTTKTSPIIHPKLNLKPKPDIRSTLTMPVNLFNRFMQQFYDLCTLELKPANAEIHSTFMTSMNENSLSPDTRSNS
jgi:hypothetical protein